MILALLVSQTALLWGMEDAKYDDVPHPPGFWGASGRPPAAPPPPPVGGEGRAVQVARLKEALQEVMRVREETPDHAARNKVIIVGPTGSGKTVLINYLAERELVVEIDPEGARRIQVTDPLPGSRIGHTIAAGTTFPFSWSSPSDVDYWDCPGFGDPSGVVQDIINAFSIHHLYVGRSKIMLAVPEEKMTGRQKDLLELFWNLTETFSVDQLCQSLSLVITKQGRVLDVHPHLILRGLVNFVGDGVHYLNGNVRALLQHLSTHHERIISVFPYPRELGAYPGTAKGRILESTGSTSFLEEPEARLKITAEARLLAGDLAQGLNEDVVHLTQTVAVEKIMNYCLGLTLTHPNPIKDMTNLQGTLRGIVETLQPFPGDRENPIEFSDRLDRFFDHAGDPNVLKNPIESLIFLRKLKPTILYQTGAWASALQPAVDRVRAFEADPVRLYLDAAVGGNAVVQNALGIIYYNGIRAGRDYVRAAEWYARAGAQGHLLAQIKLGTMYLNGVEGVEKNLPVAAEWYTRAAEQEHVFSQYNLGIMYSSGLGVERNYARAIEWYTRAAEHGYPPAQNSLAILYMNGKEVPQNLPAAVMWYTRAAELGYAPAQNNLGIVYENGIGVERDYVKSTSLYTKAAKQGYPPAQNNLGVVYENGIGLLSDPSRAAKWYARAAEQGYAPAQNNLGVLYERGVGVERDYARAVDCYMRAALQGHFVAQNNLGVLYETGNGVARNLPEAVMWYTRSAEQNYRAAQHNLAVMYENGAGIGRDIPKAVEWHTKAAEQGHVLSQYILGNRYEAGNGIPRNLPAAVLWYTRAAEQDLVNAQILLGFLHLRGEGGVVRNETEALKWLTIAANKECIGVQYILGDLYESEGLLKNIPAAVEWYTRAAAGGSLAAQNSLGLIYLNGKGTALARVERNIPEALKLLRDSAEHGYVRAQNNLGLAYLNGNGVAKSEPEALKWFRMAAAQNHPGAKRIVPLLKG